MKLVILSSFPKFDKLQYKIIFLTEVLKKNYISDLILIYSHKSLFDHYKELKKRFHQIKFKAKINNVNLLEVANHESLENFAKKNGIKIYKFDRFFDRKCIELLKEYNFDLGINFSGEYIPKTILNIPKLGVIGAHYGKLPEIRGGDTIRWTIYLNFPMYVSHFFLTDVLDMGDIALFSKVTVKRGDTILTIRKKCQQKALEGHLKILDKIYYGQLELVKQKPEMGSTYYRMGKYLAKKVDEILKNNLYAYYEE